LFQKALEMNDAGGYPEGFLTADKRVMPKFVDASNRGYLQYPIIGEGSLIAGAFYISAYTIRDRYGKVYTDLTVGCKQERTELFDYHRNCV